MFVGPACHVFGARKIKETDQCVEVIAAEALVDVFIQPGEKKGVKCLSKVIVVVGGIIVIEEDGAKLLLDELGLVSKRVLECRRAVRQETRQ